MKKRLLLALLSSAMLTSASSYAAHHRSSIDDQIKNYIMNHPEVIMSSLHKLQQQQQQKQIIASKQAALKHFEKLARDSHSPSLNKGPVTVVEFFDYQCSVCHMVFPVVEKLVSKHPDVTIVYKAFPIFGEASEYAARAAIAAQNQGSAKFKAFHQALFRSKLMEGKLKDSDVINIAKSVNLNIDQLKKDMHSKRTDAEIKSTYTLANDLGLRGTPAFIIMPSDPTKATIENITFIPGGADLTTLEKAVELAHPSQN